MTRVKPSLWPGKPVRLSMPLRAFARPRNSWIERSAGSPLVPLCRRGETRCRPRTKRWKPFPSLKPSVPADKSVISVSDRECRLFTVSGRVQGVFFRASTAQQAARLKLTGYAINLEDGDVEVLACGTADALDRLEAWLGHGPPAANVADVRVVQKEFEAREGFVTG